MDREPHEEGDQSSSGAALAKELLAVKDGSSNEMASTQQPEQETTEQGERLGIVDGLTEVKAGHLEPGEPYRFLITAAVQADPAQLGEWLDGGGQGFQATDRPVNTSLIDQDHNWTFGGDNGFILSPPESGSDVVAAAPVDIGSSDMERTALPYHSADELLAATAETTYNQINIASGKLAGVFIRVDEAGQELGRQYVNDRLRTFAQERNLPVVEISVQAKELHEGPAEMQELPAKPGNKLWKISVPGEGVLREIDVIKLSPEDQTRGMQPDANGFDLRIQEIDPHGTSEFINDRPEKLAGLRTQLEALAPSSPDDAQAIQFTIDKLGSLMTPEVTDTAEVRQETAWREYKGYDSEYQTANAERAAKGKIDVVHYPDATFIAQVRVDESTGEAISGHDYNPEAKSHQDTEAEFRRYLGSTPSDQQFMIYEGNPATFSDRATAIRQRADAGLTMFLADQAGVERTTGEPTDDEVVAEMERQGVDREEMALFTTLRSIGPRLISESEKTADQSGTIYYQLARNGVPGFREYSEEEKAAIEQQPEVRDALLREMRNQATRFAQEKFNPLLEELGLPQFEVGQDGSITLPGADGTQLVELSGPSGAGRMGEIGKLVSEYRDRHIFDTVADAVKSGKKPLVVYGGSHIVALRPALDSYFGQTPA